MTVGAYRDSVVRLPRPRPGESSLRAMAATNPGRIQADAELPGRIFIDCSAIDFAKQPTGIPRVVRKYIEVGYAWGARRGIEVIPVLPTAEGLVLVRPVPGNGAPHDLVARSAAAEVSVRSTVLGRLRGVWDYLANVAHHAAHFASALLPIPPLKSTAAWIDDILGAATQTYARQLERSCVSSILFPPARGDVLFCPAYWHDVNPSIYQALRERGVEIVILVHDLLPIIFEYCYPSPWRYTFKGNVKAAFGYASAFFCVSGYTRAALWEFGQRNKLGPVPMMTAYNGFEPLVSDAAADQIRQTSKKPILGSAKLFELVRLEPLLMVGSIEPKKGHVPVIKCLEALWQAGFPRPLLIIGRPGWMEQEVVSTIGSSFFFNKKMFWFTDADDFDLASAYIFCHALIFSSLAEGFGIPMIEAAYYGKPTIALDTPIVREVLGDRALVFDSAAGFEQHLLNLEEPANYQAACLAAAKLRWPLWEDYTPQVFERLADFPAGAARLPQQIAPSVAASVSSAELSAAQ